MVVLYRKSGCIMSGLQQSHRDTYFYISPNAIGEHYALMTDKDERRHLLRTLRKRVGDPVVFVDGKGSVYDGVIERIDPDLIRIGVTSRERDTDEPSVRVTLAPALLKGSRLDTVVDKVTELGVHEIWPVHTARTIVNVGKSTARIDRWQRIAMSAMKQSLRSRLTIVRPVLDFHEAIVHAQKYDLALIAWEKERQNGPETIARLYEQPERVLLFIGPEGGFETNEIEAARDVGIHPVSIGRRRFRADTAGIVAVTLLMATLGAMKASR